MIEYNTKQYNTKIRIQYRIYYSKNNIYIYIYIYIYRERERERETKIKRYATGMQQYATGKDGHRLQSY
jgi:hypothetical protein